MKDTDAHTAAGAGWTQPVRNAVERGAVRRFADAVGDPNPAYRSGGRAPAPPTFPCTFEYGELAGAPFAAAGLIHGEQTYHFERPLFVGDELLCSQRLAGVSARASGGARMTFYIVEQKGETDRGELVFTARLTVVRREGPPS